MVPSAAKNTCFKIEKNTTYAFSNSANTFDRNLFQVILSEKKNQNIILSSHSVSSVLSMILIGAKVKLVRMSCLEFKKKFRFADMSHRS